MADYYSRALAGERLRRCYDIAPPRVQRYLLEEIRFVCQRLQASDFVLELGCGYGRVLWQLAEVAGLVTGIDTSCASLHLARTLTDHRIASSFAAMDAARLGFRGSAFDAVVCIQNGLCAFQIDPAAVLAEALRVVRSPGRVLVSTYADRFWRHRLAWFRLQAAEGLVGDIDESATRPGTIVCRDGLTIGTLSPAELRAICARLGVTPHLSEVDGSSLFCEIVV